MAGAAGCHTLLVSFFEVPRYAPNRAEHLSSDDDVAVFAGAFQAGPTRVGSHEPVDEPSGSWYDVGVQIDHDGAQFTG